jgi:hypothetical protein
VKLKMFGRRSRFIYLYLEPTRKSLKGREWNR